MKTRRIKTPALAQTAREKLPASRWKEMLIFICKLQEESIFPPAGPFKKPWVSPGKGYIGNPAFGHWDLIHACLDALVYDTGYVRTQFENYFLQMKPDGMLPGVIYGPRDKALSKGVFSSQDNCSHPPVWPHAVDEYVKISGDHEFLKTAFEFGKKNLAWWQSNRRIPEGGYYYRDIIDQKWESGVDAGARFMNPIHPPYACIDATSHLYGFLEIMEAWAEKSGENPVPFQKEREDLKIIIQRDLWDEKTKFFYDLPMARGQAQKIKSFEGFWPLVVKAATTDQANQLVEHLLNPEEFFSFHPVPTVALNEPFYTNDMWQGPAWNSMTYWIMRGMFNYGYKEPAVKIGTLALDRSLEHFNKAGTVYEFYNSRSLDQSCLKRKGKDIGPCKDYLGHNPLNALYGFLFPY